MVKYVLFALRWRNVFWTLPCTFNIAWVYMVSLPAIVLLGCMIRLCILGIISLTGLQATLIISSDALRTRLHQTINGGIHHNFTAYASATVALFLGCSFTVHNAVNTLWYSLVNWLCVCTTLVKELC